MAELPVVPPRRRRKSLRECLTYLYLRTVRVTGTPEYIAGGVALGLAVGLIVPIGFQLVIAIPLAFILRVAKVPAAIFTFITNHFTVIIIYPFQCYIGALITNTSYSSLRADLKVFFSDPTLHNFLGIGWDVAAAFLVGGVLLAIVTATPGYFISLALVRQFRKRRAERLARKKQKKKLQ